MNWNRLQQAKKISRKVFKKYYGHWPEEPPQEEPYGCKEKDIPIILGQYRKTKVFCSNPVCCGNPRKSQGSKKERLSRQEFRADIDASQQLNEVVLWK